MADTFAQSGDMTNSGLAPAPLLRGDFIAGIDQFDAGNTLGVFVPWGGGSSVRRFSDYGNSPPAPEPSQAQAISDVLGSIGGQGAVYNYNFEGLVGPQGPPGLGTPGPTGILMGFGGGVYSSSALGSIIPNHEITFTDNDPGAGSISWGAGTLLWVGTNYSIAAGNSDKKYVYWDSGGSTGILQGTDTIGDITSAMYVLAHNSSGTSYAITPGHIAEGELLRTDTIKAYAIATDAIETAKIKADAVTAAKISVAALHGTTGELNSNYIVAGMITTDAIEQAKIKNDAVVAAKIAVSGLDGTSGDVAANHIVAGMLQTDCVTSVKVQADAITATKINVVGLDGATGRIIVADATDANVVTTGVNTYASTLIAAGKILVSGSTVLSDWSHASNATLIDGGDIYTNSVTASQIAANTITASELAADSVTAPAINVVGLDGTTGRIVVADATDANAVAAGVNTHAVTLINAGKILISGATTVANWAHGTDATKIDGGDIYTNTITATQLNVDSVEADSIKANSIITAKINNLNVTTPKIAADATSVGGSAYSQTGVSLGGTWTNIIDVTVTTTGEDMMISVGGFQSGATMVYRILKDATVLYDSSVTPSFVFNNQGYSYTIGATSNDGSTKYELQGYETISGAIVYDNSIVVRELKK